MSQPTIFTTTRLLIEGLSTSDNQFIYELVNTDGWLRFIGDRKIHSPLQATDYIQKILDNPNVCYWVVRLKENLASIGIITLIKRNYLEHHDIGFAFLPAFNGYGYAYEAAAEVLQSTLSNEKFSHILATTIPENASSIKLLGRLGLTFERELEHEHTLLHVYGIPAGMT